EEHERIVAIVVDEAKKAPRKILVIAGAGSNDTHKATHLAERSHAAGADAMLAVTPYYNKPKQDGLIAHFKAIADAASLPVVLYNVPGRTGCNLLPPPRVQHLPRPRRLHPAAAHRARAGAGPALHRRQGSVAQPRPGIGDPARAPG